MWWGGVALRPHKGYRSCNMVPVSVDTPRTSKAPQARLPLLPGEAIPIGDVAGLVEGEDGGAVFVWGALVVAQISTLT